MDSEGSFGHLVPYDLTIPEFLRRLQCLDGVEGEETLITCQVIGDPVPKIQWLKEDGTEILETDIRYEMSYCLKTGNATLKIKNTLLGDEMSYKCVASNKHGTSKTIGVLVVKAKKNKPSSNLLPPVNSSSKRSLSPLRNIDVPPSNLQPVKEETEISSSQSEDSIVDLLKITEDKSCRILERPDETIHVKEGEDLKFFFAIQGDPEPEIKWFRDNEPLKDDYRIDIYNEKNLYFLEIFDCLTRYSGVYTIQAKNSLNEIKADVNVVVIENSKKLKRPNLEGLYQYDSRKETYRPPQFTIKPMSQTVHEGRKLSLLTKVTGIPSPEVLWFRDGKPISSEPDDRRIKIYKNNDSNFFEIDNISILDTGEYTCTASNVMGAVYSAINILVEAMTEPETGASSEVCSDLDKSAPDSEYALQCSYSDNTDTSASYKSTERRNKEIAEKLVDKHVKEHIDRRLSAGHSESEKDILLQEYILLEDYKDEQREITIFKDDIVEILDIAKSEKWLVRTKYKTLNQVCYIPPKLLEPYDSSKVKKLDLDYQKQFVRISSTKHHQSKLSAFTIFGTDISQSLNIESIIYTKSGISEKEAKIKSESSVEQKDDLDNKSENPNNISDLNSNIQINNEQIIETTGKTAAILRKTASHKKFIEFQNRRTFSHESDNYLGSSSSSEDLKTMNEEAEIYCANCDFTPSDLQNAGASSLSLVENQFVEILDSQDSRFYLVRTRPRKDENPKIGWIPACFLEKKSTSIGQVNRRSTREVYRDDLGLSGNKQQEALIKRNYSFAEIIDMENRYVKDLQFVIENYLHELSKLDCPKLIKEKREFIFSNLEDIFAFHKVLFLTQLLESDGEIDRLSKVFLKNRSNFELYLPYTLNRQYSESTLNSYEIIRNFFDNINLRVNNTEYWISDYLNRPLDRLVQYRQFLQEQIKYTVRAKQNSLHLQEAYFMFCDIFKTIETRQLVDSIQNLPLELKSNDKLNRFDCFHIIDSDNRLRDRYLFLFRDHILICRLKPRTTAETIASSTSFTNSINSISNYFKGALVYKNYIPLSAIRSIKLDNFDENDDKLLIEINLDRDIINSNFFISKDTSETFENLLQNDNQKLLLQSKNPYSKLAFIKSLKDNLVCLGYLEQTIDTLNYFQEDVISTKITQMGAVSPANKKRKILSRKRSQDNSFGNEYYENNEAAVFTTSQIRKTRSDEDGDYDTEDGSLRRFPKIQNFGSGSILSSTSNKSPILSNKLSKNSKISFGSSSSNVNFNDFYSFESTNESSYHTANEHDESKPKIIRNQESINVLEGESAVFECKIIGCPKPAINWYKYDCILKDSPDFIHLAEDNNIYKLVIREANIKDSGSYKIVASNRYGQTTATFRLNVDEDLTDQDLTIIDNIDIETQKSDNTDNDVFEEDYLHISEGSPSPINDYETSESTSCTIKSFTKKPKVDYQLVIGLKPKFLKLFESCKIKENNILSLTCQVVGEPQPELKWFKDGCELISNSRVKITNSPNGVSSLLISRALLDDAGSYQVSASNQHGISVYLADIEIEPSSDFEDNIFITSLRRPSTSSSLNSSSRIFTTEKINTGESIAKIKVNVKKDDAKVNWFRDECILVQDDKYKMIENGKERILLVNNVKREDQGEYICQSGKYRVTLYLTINEDSINDVFKSSSSIFGDDDEYELYVEKTQSKLNKKCYKIQKDMFVSDGCRNVELKCKVNNPDTQVEWFRNGERISNSDKYKILSRGNERILIVKNPTISDNGNYVCQSGTHSVVLNLNVNEREKSVASSHLSEDEIFMTSQFKPELTYYVTQNAVLNCQVKNSNEPIVWFKDNRKLWGSQSSLNEDKYTTRQEGENRFLIIKNVNYQDTGNYICQSKSNPSKKIEFKMKIKEPRAEFAQELNNLKVTNLNEKVTFECITKTPRSINPYKVKWFKNNMEITQKQDPHLQMFNYCNDENVDGSVTNFNKLVISPPLSTNDQGEYTVSIDENLKSTAYLSIDPSVLTFKPEIQVKKSQLIQSFNSKNDDDLMFLKELEPFCDCDEGQDLVLECWSNKYDTQAQWYRDNMPISANSKYEITSQDGRKHRFIIRNVTPDDKAIYKCRVNDLIQTTTILNVNEHVPLKIIRGLYDIHVPEREKNLQLKVELNKKLNNSQYLIRWFLNKKEILNDSNFDFFLINNQAFLKYLREIKFNLDNNSQIEFKIQEFKHGLHLVELETKCTLTVEEDKSKNVRFFTKKLDNLVQVDSGLHLDLEARVNFEPKFVTWFKNNTPLNPNDNLIFINDALSRSFLMRISNCKPKDSGIYSIDLDGLQSSGEVKVLDTPIKFIQKLQDSFFDLDNDSSLTLDCQLNKPPGLFNLKPKWFKNGLELSPNTQKYDFILEHNICALIIYDLDERDEGKYKCQVGNEKTECQIRPEYSLIRHLPTKLELNESDTLTISFALNRAPGLYSTPVTKWFKDGIEIKEDGKKVLLNEKKNERTLTILNCGLDDIGNYKASIIDESSEPPVSLITTNNCRVHVNKLNVEFITPLEKIVQAKKDDTIKLYCETVQENLKPKWYHNEVIIETNSQNNKESFSTPTQHLLIINDVSDKDSGLYKLKFGPNQEYCSEVIVNQSGFYQIDAKKNKTEIVKPLEDVRIDEGDNLDLEIYLNRNINENDLIEIKRNGQFLLSSIGGDLNKYNDKVLQDFDINSDGDRFAFSLKNCKKTDSGLYEFNLIEIGDMDKGIVCKSKCNVFVSSYVEKAEIVKPLPRVVKFDEGERIKLECVLDKSPERTLWYHNSVQIVPENPDEFNKSKIELLSEDEGKIQILQISNAQSHKHDGTYQLNADDKITICEVKIKPVAAKFDQRPPDYILYDVEKELEEDNDTLSIECTVDKNNAPIKWFRDNQEIIPNEKYEIISEGPIRCLLIHNIDRDDSDNYYCSLGADVCKTEVKVVDNRNLEPSKILFKPKYEKIDVFEGKGVIIGVDLEPEHLKNTKWFKNTEPLIENERISLEFLEKKENLKIDKLAVGDKGLYELFYVDETENVLVSSIELNVKPKPISIIRKLNAKRIEPTLLLLECEVSKPITNQFKFYWLKDGKELDLNDRHVKIRIINEKVCQLFIDKFDHNDSGLYEFSIFDIQYPELKETTSFRLEIKQNPFKSGMKIANSDVAESRILKIEFDTVTDKLKCEDLKWLKDGVPLNINDKMKYNFFKISPTKFCLEIKNVNKSDNGSYLCSIEEFSNKLNLSGIENVVSTQDEESTTDENEQNEKEIENEQTNYLKSKNLEKKENGNEIKNETENIDQNDDQNNEVKEENNDKTYKENYPKKENEKKDDNDEQKEKIEKTDNIEKEEKKIEEKPNQNDKIGIVKPKENTIEKNENEKPNESINKENKELNDVLKEEKVEEINEEKKKLEKDEMQKNEFKDIEVKIIESNWQPEMKLIEGDKVDLFVKINKAIDDIKDIVLYKDNKKVEPNEDVKLTFTNSTDDNGEPVSEISLKLDEAIPDDTGKYKLCITENKKKPVEAELAKTNLVVAEKPLEVLEPLKADKAEYKEGEDIVLTIKLSKPLQDQEKCIEKSLEVLESNSDLAPIPLVIQGDDVHEGGTVELVARVDKPPTFFEWFKEDTPVSSLSRFHSFYEPDSQEVRLFIENLLLSDNALIHLKVDNASSSYRLVVTEIPLRIVQDLQFEILDDQELIYLRLWCLTNKSINLEEKNYSINWFLNNQMICSYQDFSNPDLLENKYLPDSEDFNKLHILNVSSFNNYTDQGTYTIKFFDKNNQLLAESSIFVEFDDKVKFCGDISTPNLSPIENEDFIIINFKLNKNLDSNELDQNLVLFIKLNNKEELTVPTDTYEIQIVEPVNYEINEYKFFLKMKNKAKLQDSGEYGLKLLSLNETSNSLVFDVISENIFNLELPEFLEILEGECLELKVKCNQKISVYHWEKDSIKYSIKSNLKSNDLSYTLKITESVLSDSGVYVFICDEFNDKPVKNSTKCTVTVKPRPEKQIKSLNDLGTIRVKEGEPLSLTVKFDRQIDENSISVFLNGKELTKDLDYLSIKLNPITNAFSIQIDSSKPIRDDGIYKVTSPNTESDCRVIVEEKPNNFLTELDNVNVKVLPEIFYKLKLNQDDLDTLFDSYKPDAEFECELSKSCTDVSWLINNNFIEESEKFTFKISEDGKKHVLIIKNCTIGDNKSQICFKLNKNSKQSQAELKVEQISMDYLIKIRRPLVNIERKEDETCNFECDIQLNSILSKINIILIVKWFKNDEEILSNEKYEIKENVEKNIRTETLKINNLYTSDSSEYFCKIYLKNDDDIFFLTESKASLKVREQEAKLLKPLPTNLEVIQGQDFEMECEISKRDLAVEWSKDNSKLLGSNFEIKTYKISEKSFAYNLKIKNPQLKQSGKYRINFKNIQSECKVIVKEPRLEILKLLDKVIYVKENDTGLLRTEYSNSLESDLIRIEWFKNSKRVYFSNKSPKYQMNISGNKLELLIKNFNREDEAKYELKIYAGDEQYQLTQSTECLLLDDELKILENLSDLNLNESETAQFNLKLSKSCPCEWFYASFEMQHDLNNFEKLTKIKPSQKIILKNKSEDNSFNLTIKDCKINDTGIYLAVLKAENGDVLTSSARLIVKDQSPKIIKDLPSQFEASTTEPFKISVLVKGDNLLVEWFYEEKKVLPLINQIESLKKGELSEFIFNFSQPFTSDSGIYKCRVQNEYGFIESIKCNVQIKDPNAELIDEDESIFHTKPRFIEYFSDVYMEEHTEAQFKCKIIGKPEPKVVWYCNCRKITGNSEKFECLKEADHYTLIVKNVSLSDEGEYTCKASNIKGETSWSSNLYLNESFTSNKNNYLDSNLIAPNFLRKIKDSTVPEGNTARLDCYIDGEPFPTIKFFKNNAPIDLEKNKDKYSLELDEDSGSCVLTIYNCVKKDEDEYLIKIENPAGQSQCSAYLSVETLEDNSNTKRRVRFSLPKDSDVFIIPSNEMETPKPPTNPQIENLKKNSLTLKWDPSPSDIKFYDKEDKDLESQSNITYIVEYRSSKSYAWSVYCSCLEELTCEVNNLSPSLTYSFRIRAENLSGVSIPTQVVSTKNLQEIVEKKPEVKRNRFELGQKPSIQAPGKDVRYYIDGETADISIPVYGSPLPTVKYLRNNIELNDETKYKIFRDRLGNSVLEIYLANEKDEGPYEIIATNEYGEARHEFYLQQADPPVFLEPFKDVTVKNYDEVCIQCKVDGIPYPEVKFYKDWHLLTESHRIKIKHTEPDTWTITIKGSIVRDSGLYTCTAKNIAGGTLCSCNVNVVESVLNTPHPDLKTDLVVFKRKKFDEDYEILEQVNQSLNSRIYRVIERRTAKEFLAKIVHKPEYKEWVQSELECLNQINETNSFVKLHDAYELSNPQMQILIFEECKGRNLIENTLKNENLNEKKVALFIKDLLELLDVLHSRNIVHLDLNPDNIVIDSNKKLKLLGFTHSKSLKADMTSNDTTEKVYHDYGHVEFVSPEIVSQAPITLNTDMWSVGVLAHILLSGKSPFYVEDNLKQTLENIGNCKWQFSDHDFKNISHEAKDFIQKLLVKNPNERLNARTALNHPWIHFASQLNGAQSPLIDKQNLIESHSRWLWSKQSKLREPWKKQIPISRILDEYDPNDTGISNTNSDSIEIVDHLRPHRERSISFDEFNIKEKENYYYGDDDDENLNPGTYLLPVKDPLFTVRLREYRRSRFEKVKQIEKSLITRHRSSTNTLIPLDARTIKERYHVDVYGRCIKRGSLSRSTFRSSNSRYLSESPSSRKSESFNQFSEYLDSKIDKRQLKGEGSAPIIREKLKDMFLLVGSVVTFRCRIEGNPTPKCFWYHNDKLIIGDDDRFKFSQAEDGVSTLSISKARVNDIGVYRCAAHNQHGTAITKARLTVGDTPDRPSRPIVSQYSSDQVFLVWEAPSFNGNSDILCYKVDCKISGDVKWSNSLYTIQESCLIKNLQPLTPYRFRVSCINTIGISAYSWASEEVTTLSPGESKITIDQDQIEALIKDQYNLEKRSEQNVLIRKLNEDLDLEKKYKIPDDEVFKLKNENPFEFYQEECLLYKNKQVKFISVVDKTNSDKKMLKICQIINLNEIDILRKLKEQDRLIKLLEGFEYEKDDRHEIGLVYLHAVPILDFVTYRHKYSEELVVKILRQLLDAVQWIHLHGYIHFNIHPLSILNSNLTQVNLKLSGFENSIQLSELNNDDGSIYDQISLPLEFTAPEIINREQLSMSTDVWSIGVLAALLLSGSSPFLQETDQETTKANISFCRFTYNEFYDDVTGEAVLFIQQCLKRSPSNRLTLHECMDHKLFNLSVSNSKKRENILFLSEKLKCFNHEFKSRFTTQNN
ncbi:unnamed protein product [Brachionus calyciflorus]|uniref:Uncharacterized protein n=1 Tax=Brachionus calyciflorus TaxID=104777 RepID=A0A813NTC8_9BILA|nr:unnamed protein product [Brachionus calyciflorus]